MNRTSLLACVLGAGMLLVPLLAVVQAQTPPTPAPSAHAASAQPHKPRYSSEGERIFAQNCSRCHRTPDGFPPSISGTVLHHMRVRANLSQQDEKELLHFLNP